MSDNQKSENKDIVKSSSQSELAVDEDIKSKSDDKETKKAKLKSGFSSKKERKERGKSAADTVGRKIVTESKKTKDAEMDTQGSNPIKVVSKLVKNAPLSAKVAVLGACYYNHNTKRLAKKVGQTKKELQLHQHRESASGSDTFKRTYDRIMMEYAMKALEKKEEKLAKRQDFIKQVGGTVESMLQSLERATNTNAQRRAANTLVGDTSGANRAILATSSYNNTSNDMNDVEFGG